MTLLYTGVEPPALHGFWWRKKVPTPGWLNYERYGTFANIYAGAPAEKAYAWTIAQVKSILKEETYIGHSIHNKQSNISFKNKKKGAEAAGRMVSCGKYPRSHHF